MKLIYCPSDEINSNIIKAHLESAGLEVFLHGENLGHSIGELPTQGNIRLFVRDDQFDRAKEVLGDYLKYDSEVKIPANTSRNILQRIVSFFLGFLTCLILSSLLIVFLYNQFLQSEQQGNKSEKSREAITDNWSSSNGFDILSRDRNNDGKVDQKLYYKKGTIVKSEEDPPFEGSLSIFTEYENGNAATSHEFLVDRSEHYELRSFFSNDQLSRVDTFLVIDNKLIKQDFFRNGRLDRSVLNRPMSEGKKDISFFNLLGEVTNTIHD